MGSAPLELRRQAEHCRLLADCQIDERLRLILETMASEFDGQADAIDQNERCGRLESMLHDR